MTATLNEYGQMVDGHLGGYVPGGDPHTFEPGVWAYLIARYQLRSVLDVGCGDGATVRWFRDRGLRTVGIDGIPQDDPDIVTHDFELGPWQDLGGGPMIDVDLVWAAEFVEHVEERYVPNFVATFRCAPVVAMTHAVPGQGGWHHVNCRTSDYWWGVLAGAGFVPDWRATNHARAVAQRDGYFHRTGLVAVRP